MFLRRRLLIFATVIFLPGISERLDAQEETGPVAKPDDLFRVFHTPDIDWVAVLNSPEPTSDPFPPNPYGRFGDDPPRYILSGKLTPLFEGREATDLSEHFRDAGIAIAEGWAIHGVNMPLLFVRADPEEMKKLEQKIPPGNWIGTTENLWCRALVVAGAAEDVVDATNLDPRTVLSDLTLFTTEMSEIRMGSLAGDTGEEAKDPEAWGASLQLRAPPRDDPFEAEIRVGLSLRSPPVEGRGRSPFRLDWEGEFRLSSIGEPLTVPVTFEGEAGPGHLILRFDTVPAYAWDEPVSELVRRKEEQWRKLGPGFVPEAVPDFHDADSDAWAKAYYYIDPATDSAYLEANVLPDFLSSAPGLSIIPLRPVSAAGFRDVFSSGAVYDTREILEAFGMTFRTDDFVVYSASRSKVFGRAAPDQIMLIDAVIAAHGPYGGERMIRLRTATLETPLDRSAGLSRPLISSMKDARLTDSSTLVARSGQRINLETGRSTFKIEPVLGPEDRTIDLVVDMKHRETDQPDYAILIGGIFHRDQTAMIRLGPSPDSPGTVRHIAFRTDLIDQLGRPHEPRFTESSWNPEGAPERTPKTLWEKRGPGFKLR